MPSDAGPDGMRPISKLLPLLLALTVASAYAIHVQRYAFLGDDAFISFRYALNWISGHGLVFNPGEVVEGYTNFLWVVAMGIGMRIGLPVEIFSQLLGILAGIGVLLVVARFSARRWGWRDPLVGLAPLALASNRSFAAWSTGGLETMLFTFFVVAATLQAIVEHEARDSRPWRSALLFALAGLTRPEGLLFAAIACVAIGLGSLRKTRSLESLRVWLLVAVPPIALHFAWRLTYYGYPLPNTFYAKVSGVWLEQSMYYFQWFLDQHQMLLLLPLALLPLLRRRDFACAMVFANLVLYLGYVALVGGDRFEFRFLTVALPLLFWLMQEGVGELRQILRDRRPTSPIGTIVAGALALLMLASAWRPNTLELEPFHGIQTLERIADYAERRSQEGRFVRHLVEEGFLTGEELLAVRGAGALPYYSRLPTLDMLGLSDIHVAHQPLTTRGVVGHEKQASREYLVQRRVVMQDVKSTLVLRPGVAPPPESVAQQADPPVHCVEALGRHLIFTTTLDREEFARVFSRFEILY